MTTSSMLANKFFKKIIILLFWLTAWQIIAMAVNLDLLVPSPVSVAKTWIKLASTSAFWKSTLLTLLRVLSGFVLGTVLGALFSFLTARFKIISQFSAPLLHIIKATPIASFSILALIWIKTDYLPVFVAFLVVFPMIWESTENALLNLDKKLLETAKVFNLSKSKRFFYIVVPSVFPQFITACVTALGFSWKSGVAAEVISLPEVSLGKLLYNSKIMFETAEVFSVTVTTVILSVIFEKLFKTVVKKYVVSEEKQNGRI